MIDLFAKTQYKDNKKQYGSNRKSLKNSNSSYIRRKTNKQTNKSAHKHKINNLKWNTHRLTLTGDCAHTHTHTHTQIKQIIFVIFP